MFSIYPTWEAIDGTIYADKGDRQHPTRVVLERIRKRFSDAELAAEGFKAAAQMFAAELDGEDIDAERLEGITDSLHRFATANHYDEEQQ